MLSVSTIKKIRNYASRIGCLGESAVCRIIAMNGWDVLCRNYRCGKKEIDIVARNNGILHFIEVKTRRMRPHSYPVVAVNWEKRQNIIIASRQYLRELGNPQIQCRYDIAEVYTSNGKICKINLLENMFRSKRTKH